jgi:hypothetical protein
VITNDSSLAFPNLANKTLCILMQYSSCLWNNYESETSGWKMLLRTPKLNCMMRIC